MIRRLRTPRTWQPAWTIDEACSSCGRRLQSMTDIDVDRLRALHRRYGCRHNRP